MVEGRSQLSGSKVFLGWALSRSSFLCLDSICVLQVIWPLPVLICVGSFGDAKVCSLVLLLHLLAGHAIVGPDLVV